MRQERIIFMGTPEISKAYLQSLIDNKYNIIATYTQPPRKQGRGMLDSKKSPVHDIIFRAQYSSLSPKEFHIFREHR